MVHTPNKTGPQPRDWDPDDADGGRVSPKNRKARDDYDDLPPGFAAACKTVDAKTLPKLIISSSDPTAAAKDLATLIARRDDFLFNGHAPVRIAAEADCLPRALEVTTEMVRILAHEICVPTKGRKLKDCVVERIPVPLSNDIAQLYLHGLEGSWGLEPFHGI